MLIPIPGLLPPDRLAAVRELILDAEWSDGKATAGHQSALAKDNEQLAEGSEAARRAGEIVLDALAASPLFVAAALPLKVYPPLFSRYRPGHSFGDHVDGAIRVGRGSDFRVRSDLSATLFLESPDAYDGGALAIDDMLGGQRVKLAAGDLLVYPASSVHRVEPVTRGTRLTAIFWIQSMVRDDAARRLLLDLDRAIQAIAADRGEGDPEIVRLTGVYHNLLRRWADA
jgi:PKHD-type hydroxylase